MGIPLFTVVVPVYNSAATVGAAVDSALRQTFEEFELLVVDDGSTDETANVLEAYSDPRLRVITQRPGSGTPAGARNAALGEATGQFSAFLDADDQWHPSKLERIAEVLASDPKCDVVCHAVELRSATGVGVGTRFYDLDAGVPVYEQLLYRGNFLTTSATTVRTALLRDLGGFAEDIEQPIAEDFDLWIRLAEKGAEFLMLPDVLGVYRVGEGISSRLAKSFSDTFCVLDQRYDALARTRRLNVRAALMRRARARVALARDLFRQGRTGAGMAAGLVLPVDLTARWLHYERLMMTHG